MGTSPVTSIIHPGYPYPVTNYNHVALKYIFRKANRNILKHLLNNDYWIPMLFLFDVFLTCNYMKVILEFWVILLSTYSTSFSYVDVLNLFTNLPMDYNDSFRTEFERSTLKFLTDLEEKYPNNTVVTQVIDQISLIISSDDNKKLCGNYYFPNNIFIECSFLRDEFECFFYDTIFKKLALEILRFCQPHYAKKEEDDEIDKYPVFRVTRPFYKLMKEQCSHLYSSYKTNKKKVYSYLLKNIKVLLRQMNRYLLCTEECIVMVPVIWNQKKVTKTKIALSTVLDTSFLTANFSHIIQEIMSEKDSHIIWEKDGYLETSLTEEELALLFLICRDKDANQKITWKAISRLFINKLNWEKVKYCYYNRKNKQTELSHILEAIRNQYTRKKNMQLKSCFGATWFSDSVDDYVNGITSTWNNGGWQIKNLFPVIIKYRRNLKKAINPSSKEKSELQRKSIMPYEEAKTNSKIEKMLEFHPKTLTMSLSNNPSQEKALLEVKSPGRRQRYIKIDIEIKRQIINTVEKHSPKEIGLYYPVWSRKKIGELICKVSKHSIPERTIGYYIKIWDLIPTNFRDDFFSRKDKEAKKWKDKYYTAICNEARCSKGIVLWINHTVFKPSHKTQQTDQKQLVKLSAVRNNNEVFFLFRATFNQETLIEFCEIFLDYFHFPKVIFILEEEGEYVKPEFIRWLNQNYKISYYYLPKEP